MGNLVLYWRDRADLNKLPQKASRDNTISLYVIDKKLSCFQEACTVFEGKYENLVSSLKKLITELFLAEWMLKVAVLVLMPHWVKLLSH